MRSTTPVLPAYGFLQLTWSAQSTRFTALFMLAHASLLQSLHCPVHGIHSIRHAGSRFCTNVLYTTISMRFTASVQLAHESSTAIIALPYPRDSQHLSCWFINLSCCPCAGLFMRFKYLSCWLMSLCWLRKYSVASISHNFHTFHRFSSDLRTYIAQGPKKNCVFWISFLLLFSQVFCKFRIYSKQN
jgi:hypothetical protein